VWRGVWICPSKIHVYRFDIHIECVSVLPREEGSSSPPGCERENQDKTRDKSLLTPPVL
jgi:hypothetical protein